MRNKPTLEGESQLIEAFHKDQAIFLPLPFILAEFDDVFNARVLQTGNVHLFHQQQTCRLMGFAQLDHGRVTRGTGTDGNRAAGMEAASRRNIDGVGRFAL